MRRTMIVAAAILTTVVGLSAPAHANQPDPPNLSGPPTVAPSQLVRDGATPKGVTAAKGAPPEVGSAASLSPNLAATTFMYGASNQFAAADGSAASFRVASPFLAAADAHSLAELAAQSADGNQIVEVGWNVDRAVNGNATPHLFVFRWVDRIPSCYNGCGFVQYSSTVRPGQALGVGTTARFTIQHFQGNWWIGLNSDWVGYYPDSLWSGRFTRTGLVQWFGEVAAGSTSPCTDMGNGAFASSASATPITGISFINGPAVSLSVQSTHPAYYTAGTTSSNSIRFGGPGAC